MIIPDWTKTCFFSCRIQSHCECKLLLTSEMSGHWMRIMKPSYDLFSQSTLSFGMTLKLQSLCRAWSCSCNWVNVRTNTATTAEPDWMWDVHSLIFSLGLCLVVQKQIYSSFSVNISRLWIHWQRFQLKYLPNIREKYLFDWFQTPRYVQMMLLTSQTCSIHSLQIWNINGSGIPMYCIALNSMPTGIIPWNATPGKACGSTLGDICNTSEVRRFFFYLKLTS